MFKRLHPLFEMEGAIGSESGVEAAPAAEVQASEGTADQTGAESQAAAEPEKQNNFEKAFAKRLAEAEKKWQAETAEKYKDYDVMKKTSEYFAEINGVSDVMTLAEKVEMERLQDAAEKQNVPVEVLKRLQELEAKAAKGDELEQQQAQAKTQQEFENTLKEFAKDKMIGDKPLDHNELWKYMHEEQIGKPEAAFKAMKAEVLEKQLEEAEKNGMKKLLNAKSSIPNVTGNKAVGQVTAPAPKTFAEARARAMQRMSQTE